MTTGRRLTLWAIASAGWAVTTVAVLLYAGLRVAALGALVPAGIVAASVVVRAARGRRSLGLILTWAGLVSPFIVGASQRSVTDLQSGLLTPLNVFEGLAPIAFFLAAWMTCKKRILPLRGRERYLLVFGAICLLSMLWSVQPLATALRASQLFVVYLLLILLIRQLGDVTATVQHIIGAVYVGIGTVVVGLVLDTHAAVEPQFTFDFARQVEVRAPSRLQGLVPYINSDLLGLLAVVALLALVSGVGPRWAKTRPREAVIGVSSLAVLMLSGSRTGVVLLAIGLLVLAVLDARSRARVLVLLMVAVVALLAVPAIQNVILEHLRRGQDTQALSSLTGRTEIWREALSVWRKQPLIGYGYYAGHRFLGSTTGQNQSNLDNMYIETLVDTGLVGLSALVVFLFAELKHLTLSARSAPKALSLAVAVAALTAAFVNPSLQTPDVVLIVVGGLLLAPWTAAPRRRQFVTSRPPTTRRVRTGATSS